LAIDVSEMPNPGGATLSVELPIAGEQSGAFPRVLWMPTRMSWTMNDSHSSGQPLTITSFDTGGGLLEGDFQNVALGCSCEGIDAILIGHFAFATSPTIDPCRQQFAVKRLHIRIHWLS
jgi:hypothetical protein